MEGTETVQTCSVHVLFGVADRFLLRQYIFFVIGEMILSQEGTTKGDPLNMATYALGTLLVSYADNESPGGLLTQLHSWWNKLEEKRPAFGYFVNLALFTNSQKLDPSLGRSLRRITLPKLNSSSKVLVSTSCALGGAILEQH